ncbi:MAG: hypothetical protein IPM43_13430 [Actinomycetota bacterium]|nr:MAG: hypothetical protein IPM43_13430 [Actinomycetota bacterium]
MSTHPPTMAALPTKPTIAIGRDGTARASRPQPSWNTATTTNSRAS